MNANPQPTAYGRIFPPRADWLARAPAEPIIEPELPIIDTHHHVWRDRGRYMLDELLADTGSGHNVVATVFIDCRFQYRTEGPAELRSVGEVETVAALAEQCAAEHPGKTRVAQGIVGLPTSRSAIAWSRCWRRWSRPGAAASAACAIPPAGTRIR